MLCLERALTRVLEPGLMLRVLRQEGGHAAFS